MMDQASNSVVELEEVVNVNETKCLWVFGYGSLCWNPGFSFDKAATGHIQGYSRKFWQGNSTHRGTEQKPGRVATLVKDEVSIVHGLAFRITGEAALTYLAERECKMGGYITEFTTFYPCSSGIPFTTVLYIATSKNSLWLGDAPLPEIANQITDCSGPSGHNVEYLLRLANFMHHHFPEEKDDHLFNLEQLVRHKITDKKMCLQTLMGDGKNLVTFVKQGSQNNEHAEEPEERVDSFQFTTRVPGKVLRCLNI